jgi:hypothetical protein
MVHGWRGNLSSPTTANQQAAETAVEAFNPELELHHQLIKPAVRGKQRG